MSRQQTPFKADDYNEPTEPLEHIYLPPSLTVPGVPGVVPEALGTSLPEGYPYHQSPAAYPVLPQAPFKKYQGVPPGGATRDSRPARMRRSPVPGLVRFFLFLVQLVLVARIVCVLFGVQTTTAWLTLLVAASDLCVLPVRWLAANINLAVLAGTELLIVLELLVALLAYGIFSRLLVRLLKAVFNS